MWKPKQIQQTDPRHKSPAHDPEKQRSAFGTSNTIEVRCVIAILILVWSFF